MPVSAGQTVVAVLAGEDPPGALGDDVEVRLAGDADLARALSGADVLLVWDFLSHAVAEAWRAADTSRPYGVKRSDVIGFVWGRSTP